MKGNLTALKSDALRLRRMGAYGNYFIMHLTRNIKS
jgi:hypothetical protein